MNTALYFPYIQVPHSTWFTQVLLYWDRASTIVPSSRFQDQTVTNPYMRELRDAGLLEW